MKQKKILLAIDLIIAVFISMSFNAHSQETDILKIKQEIAEKGIKEFIREIDESPSINKSESIRLLGELKDPKLIKPIIDKFLKDKSEIEQVRIAAAYALGEINNESAAKALVNSLNKDKSALVRLQAVIALGKLVKKGAFRTTTKKWEFRDELISFNDVYLKDPVSSKSFRSELIKIGDPAVEPLYILLLDDYSDYINEPSVVSILQDIGSPKAIYFLIFGLYNSLSFSLTNNIKKALLEIGKPAAKRLIEISIDPESFLTDLDFVKFTDPTHIWRLEKNPREVAEKFQRDKRQLLKNLDYHPASTNELANYYIAVEDWNELTVMGKSAVEPLITALDYKDSNIRKRAVVALGEIKDPKAVDPLINVLMSDNDYEVRKQAANVLGIIKDPRAINPLIMIANLDSLTKTWSINALLDMEVTDPVAIELYIRSLNLDSDDLKLKAANMILNSNDPKALKSRPQALQVIASLIYIKEIVNYDNYGRPASGVLKNTEGQEVAKKKFMFSPYNSTIKSAEVITDPRTGNDIHATVYDDYGNPKNQMWLCLDKKGDIIRSSGKPVLAKPYDDLQKSKSEIVDNIRGFKDKKITMIYLCKNCVSQTGVENCIYIW